jgi:hypothetical protein
MRHDPTSPQVLLHLEGAALLVGSLVLYGELGVSWWLFVLLFLAPDLALLAYLGKDKRLAAMCYNIAHTYVLPVGLFVLGFIAERGWMMGLALIWVAHIGFDRLLGFGLKYPTVFKPTHVQQAGLVPEPVVRPAPAPPAGDSAEG